MPIHFACACGKTLEVEDQHLGKKARCPACGQVNVVVEAPVDAVVVPATEAPIPHFGSWRWLFVGGCGLFALATCLICGTGGTWLYTQRDPGDDLAFVHADIAGFVSLRVADAVPTIQFKDELALADPRIKNGLNLRLAEMERKLGMNLSHIERFTLINRTLDSKDWCVVLRTTRVMDRGRVLAMLPGVHTEKRHERGSYVLVDRAEYPLAVHLVNARILLIAGKEDTLRAFLEPAKGKPNHPVLAEGLDQVAAGKHFLVIAYKANPAIMKQAVTPQDNLPNLLAMTGMRMTGLLDHRFVLEMTQTYRTPEEAERALADQEQFRNRAVEGFKQIPPRDDRLGTIMAALLESLLIRRQGPDVILEGRTDLDLTPLADVLEIIDGR